MFTEKAQDLIERAKEHAFTVGSSELTLSALMAAVGRQSEACTFLAESLEHSLEKVRATCPEFKGRGPHPGKLTLPDSVHAVLGAARELAADIPDREHPGLVDLAHLSCALAMSADACALLQVPPAPRQRALAVLAVWYDRRLQTPRLEELVERLRELRRALLTRVFGQDHAVHAFVDGLFNAEVVASGDASRKAPRAVFVFAGPPGVGKTFLAELGATALQRPYKRFDMSGYSGHQQNEALVGMARSFMGAHPGVLTEFVEKNPNAVLLFDEIEKAHRNTIHLFLQILDAGVLEDKYQERDVAFRDTTIIFTTNVGRSLYDRPNSTGVHSANATFHRRTILDALESERDPLTREPYFPSAICSRIATGYPVLFNHLRVNELESVARAEIDRVAGLIERQYFKSVRFHELVPLALVLREGASVDARTLRAQAESFVKNELFKFAQSYRPERLGEVLEAINEIYFTIEDIAGTDGEIGALAAPPDRPQIGLLADVEVCELYRRTIPEVAWHIASNLPDALELLGDTEVDFALLDIWFGRPAAGTATTQSFDHVPPSTRGLDAGQELLRTLHERLPDLPVYLVSWGTPAKDGARPPIDDELFLACVRAGGARGIVESLFVSDAVDAWERGRDEFLARLLDIRRRLYRERKASQLGDERKVLTFDTAHRVERRRGTLVVELRNPRLSRAISASDVGEILEDVERPSVRFDDVIGATAAKEELQFFVEYLRNPKRFAALGLRPPKGVLLHGPPGTGKTMLARALAGECRVAFLPATASSFVTMWQGSGPQSIRDLFTRARKYAPAIIFIDEIDAIGRVRTGSAGSGQAQETTLNALLTEMEGFAAASHAKPVLVLAATNFGIDPDSADRPDRSGRALDAALVRRFDRAVLIDLPDRDARQQYLGKRLLDRPSSTIGEETIDRIAAQSAGMTISNLEAIVEAAARRAAKLGGAITDELVEEAFEAARHGEVRTWTPDLLERTARHEAGHTVMYWLSGSWPAYVTIVARGHHGGYMEPDSADRQRELRTRQELLADIRTALGGRAAEMLCYGDDAGISTGVSGDLESATERARLMVCAYGMDEEVGLVALPEILRSGAGGAGSVSAEVTGAIRRILRREMDQTVALLQEHRGDLERVAAALLEKNRLTRTDLQALLASRTPPKVAP